MKSLNNENLIINCKTNIIIKNKGVKEAKYYLNKYSSKKNVLFVIDSYLKNKKNKLKYIKDSFNFFKKKSYYFNSFFEPNFNNLENIKYKLNGKKYDLIIGIGGGSTMDIAKGLSVVLKYKRKLNNLQGLNKFTFKPLPVICIPSIFGSGAEITPSAVFINNEKNLKGGINSNLLTPKIAILDTYFVQSPALSQHAICAFDALVHSIESYTSKIANVYTKNLSILGSEYIIRGLTLLSKKNKLGFDYIACGSIFSIISLMHAEQSLAGASSYPMAVYFNKKHALCGANYLSSSIKIINSKKSNIFDELILNLFQKKLIKENNIKSLVDKLDYFKNFFKMEKIKFSEKEKKFLIKEIYNMKMLEFSAIKFNRNDIKNFLNYEKT